nr:replication protein [uncultured Psychrobacter sp.]
MQAIKRQTMKETGYTRVDNKIFDAQPFLSPVAFSVLMRMVRMIDGYGNDDKGLSNTFLQSNCNMSKNTVSKAVKELIEFGFLDQKRQQRTTTIYSLNYENIADFNAKEHGQNLASQNLASQNMTIRFPKYDQELGQNLGGNKEKKEKPLKKNIEKNKPKKETSKSYSPEKPESVSDQIWNDLLILRKDKKTSNTKTAWTTIFNALEKAQQATGHTLDQIIAFWITKDWKGFNADWYLNAQPKPQQTNYQGNNHANHQSANHSNQPNHFDSLRAEIAAKYGTSEQPRDIRTVSETFGDDDRYV